jgi:hypothetical protein
MFLREWDTILTHQLDTLVRSREAFLDELDVLYIDKSTLPYYVPRTGETDGRLG